MRHTRTILAALAATGLLLIAAPLAANALVSYPPGSLLQPSDVATSTIRDYAVSPPKIASGLNFTMHGLTTTNSTSTNATTTILAVTSATTSFNGVNYYWPSTGGSASNALTTDGSGKLSWAATASALLTYSTTAGEAITKGSAVALGDGSLGVLANVGGTGTAYIFQDTSPWYSQAITTPSAAATITSVTISYSDSGQYWTSATVNIYACSGDKPTGTPLGTFGFSNVGPAATVATNETTNTGTAITVQPNTEYCVVLAGTRNVATVDIYGNASAGQKTYYSTDSGTTWTAQNGALYVTINGTATTIGEVYEASSAASNFRLNNYVGIAEATVAAGSTVAVDISGISTATSTLTAGSTYYLNDTNGSIGTSAGTNSKKIGKAFTASSLWIIPPPL